MRPSRHRYLKRMRRAWNHHPRQPHRYRHQQTLAVVQVLIVHQEHQAPRRGNQKPGACFGVRKIPRLWQEEPALLRGSMREIKGWKQFCHRSRSQILTWSCRLSLNVHLRSAWSTLLPGVQELLLSVATLYQLSTTGQHRIADTRFAEKVHSSLNQRQFLPCQKARELQPSTIKVPEHKNNQNRRALLVND